MATITESHTARSSQIQAWVDAIAIWLLGCLLLGLGCFVLVGSYLHDMADRYWAAIWWQLSFACALAVIMGAIIALTRMRGVSLAEMGWGKRPTRASLVAGFLLGALYVVSVYAGILNEPAMKGVNPLALDWIRVGLVPVGILMAIAEELMMRGFFMNRLAAARIPTWIQILLSGLCSAAYHSFHNPSWIGFIPSFVLFSIHAILFVAAGRSLTPSVAAHSMYHVLCAPYLLMFAMSQATI